jgi:hypothetical protein
MVCEVSRLFDTSAAGEPHGWRRRAKNGARIVDLYSLIEALVLHETLYVMPGDLDINSASLEFRRALIEKRILQEVGTERLHPLLSDTLLLTLSRLRDTVSVSGKDEGEDSPINFETDIKPQIAKFLEMRPRRDPIAVESDVEGSLWKRREKELRIGDSIDYFTHDGRSDQLLNAESLEVCGMTLIRWIKYHVSGSYENCTSVLRDMYYILAAEALEIPYWPQSSRRDFASRFPNYLDKKLLIELYRKLAAEFESTIADVYDDHKREVAFIPPFATLVLSRSKTPQDMATSIFEVREEFDSLRKNLARIEEERQQADTLGERIKLRKAQRDLLVEVGSAFSNPGILSLEGVLRYAPELAAPVAKPADLTSYSPNLLMAPVKQLARWWRRRPIAKLFELSDKLRETEDYPKLVRRVFGEKFEFDQ